MSEKKSKKRARDFDSRTIGRGRKGGRGKGLKGGRGRAGMRKHRLLQQKYFPEKKPLLKPKRREVAVNISEIVEMIEKQELVGEKEIDLGEIGVKKLIGGGEWPYPEIKIIVDKASKIAHRKIKLLETK